MPKTLSTLQAIEFESASSGFYSGWVGVEASLAEVTIPAQAPGSLSDVVDTPLGLAQALWDKWQPLLPLTSVELSEASDLSAVITRAKTWVVIPGQFSAAHRTYAPRLSEAENRALYGKCANLHGHNYRAEVALPPHSQWPEQFWEEFDHVNLSTDIPDLRGRNVVTESIAELIAHRAPEAEWVRVWELPDFFAEYHRADSSYRLGRRYTFRAAGRLATLSVTVRGDLDPRTETAYDLGQLDHHCLAVIRKLDYTSVVSATLVRSLWSQLADRLSEALTTLQLWETHRQRFSLGD